MFASVLLLTETHLYNIRRIPEREGMGYIRYRFAFSAIARITGLFECLLICIECKENWAEKFILGSYFASFRWNK